MRRRGLTFLEVLLGLVILSLAIVPLIGLSLRTTKGIQVSLDEIEATNVATSVLESLQAAPWELLSEQYGDPGVELENLPQELLDAIRVPPPPEGFKIYVNIMHSEVAPLAGEAGLPQSVIERMEELRAVRLIEVRCVFQTKAMNQRVGATRSRRIEISTIASKAARI